jgi:nitric oxide reductase NorE protein
MGLLVQMRSARVRASRPKRLPGVEGIWVFVAGDLTAFGILFASFMVDRRREVGLFEASRHGLSPAFGGLYTLLLLTSSWFMALAVDAARRSRTRVATAFLASTLVCGAAFIVAKAIEYTGKVEHGVTLSTNHFYMYYFTLTGIHLAHVVAGTVVVAVLWRRSRTGAYTAASVRGLEIGATYWHMVDLLWILVFAVLYLVR